MSCEERKPANIIFFMVDQLAAKWFELAVDDGVCNVPNMRKLKAQGTYFPNCFTSNPVCMPARATIATGLNTRGHGLLENGYYLDQTLPTFMQVLKESGYLTGGMGKIHFRPHFEKLDFDYRQYGFDVTHVTEDSRAGEWLEWVRENHPEYFSEVLATVWAWKIPEFANYGPYQEDLQGMCREASNKMTWETEASPKNSDWSYTLPFPEEISQTAWITRKGIEFIRKAHGAGHPFFAHISYVQPHPPYCCPQECLDQVDVDRIPEPDDAEWLIDDETQPGYFKRQEEDDVSNWKWERSVYLGDLVHLDMQLGKIIHTLEEIGELENTYIVLLTDHGDLLYDHHFFGKEERHYDACIRIPLIISNPNLESGQIVDEIVQLEDVCPTVLEMSGTSMPILPKIGDYLQVAPEQLPILPGNSLLPYCRKEEPLRRRSYAYIESFNTIRKFDPGDWARTIRTKQYRYTYYPRSNGEQLFNLEDDGAEQRNLCMTPEYENKKQELKDMMLEAVIMQDYPKTRRSLFAFGVH